MKSMISPGAVDVNQFFTASKKILGCAICTRKRPRIYLTQDFIVFAIPFRDQSGKLLVSTLSTASPLSSNNRLNLVMLKDC